MRAFALLGKVLRTSHNDSSIQQKCLNELHCHYQNVETHGRPFTDQAWENFVLEMLLKGSFYLETFSVGNTL